MHLIIKRLCFLVGLTLCFIGKSYCQVVTSTKNGIWTDPTVWDSGVVPSSSTASETVVSHDVIIPGSVLGIQNVVVNGTLTLESASIVNLIADALPSKWDLQVFGTLVLSDGAVLNGTSVTNTRFESGARYVHLQGPLGFIPYAAWDKNSTFEIAGFKAQGYINIAHSDSWKQTFGNVIYNCTQQTTAFVDLNGYLRNITGSFIVRSTNNQALRLSTTQNPAISVGGDFIIEGSSKVWFSTAPTNATVNVQRDFRYRSTSTGISYLTTKGVITINVQGELEMNSPGRIHLASTSTDSTGARLATVALQGNLTVVNGTIVGPPAPGKGTIHFNGSDIQVVTTPPSANIFQGTIDYVIETEATVDMNTSVLSNAAGALIVKGTLKVGSLEADGAIQTENKGNIQVQGQRTFEPGSTIEYNGVATQRVGAGHPSSPEVNVIFSNVEGVTMLKEIQAANLTVTGKLDTQQFSLTVFGHLSLAENAECKADRIVLSGNREQLVSASGITLSALAINKTAGAVRLISPLKITKLIALESANTEFYSDGNLILLSTSDEPNGTASVAPLLPGSRILGDVTVQRHMAAEGRLFRYISSPVQNATVASLKDDFSITGQFLDPSGGSRNPSFYYYDESMGSLQAGWLPFPTSGLASANPLVVGRGYASYIQGTGAVVWDVTGPLNQGSITLPITFTNDDQPANGWNLVGNPYASAIEWSESSQDKWTIQNISSVVAIRDNATSGGMFRYLDLDDVDPEIPLGKIALGQSFWVRATAANPQIVIHEDAKASDGATFFRKESETVPGFAVKLSRDGVEDIAYFKIRPQAKAGIDNWDGVKLENDNFDLSLISADHISLAIQATNRIPCDTIIPISLKNLQPGTYHLNVMPRREFARYEYFVLDKFLNTISQLTGERPLALTVTSNPMSRAFDRISLQLREREPDTTAHIEGVTRACVGTVIQLKATNVEAGVTYSWWHNDTFIDASKAEKNSDMYFDLPIDLMTPGEHAIYLKAQTSCVTLPLTLKSHSVVVEEPAIVSVDTVSICPGTSAVLAAGSNQQNSTFAWFGSKWSADTLGLGHAFKTVDLYKPETYYVSAITPVGCHSRRFPAAVRMHNFDSAKISLAGDTLLSSNYQLGNQWFFNQEKLDENGVSVLLRQAGTYTLRVDTLGCSTADNFTYEMLSVNTVPEQPNIHPNPVDGVFFVPKDVQRVEIIDALGKIIVRNDVNGGNAVDTASLPDGAYVVIMSSGNEKRIARIVKRRR